MIEARRQWAAEQLTLEPDRIVFIDETCAKTNMTRTYGRSPRGSRLRAKVPSARWEKTTFLGAMRSTGFVAPLCIEGAVNGDLFSGWVEQHLAPTLRPGVVVVMDNSPATKCDASSRPSNESAPRSATCHPTRPTSTPSRWPSASLKNSSATEPDEPTTPSGNSAAKSSIYSPNKNAETTSGMRGINTVNCWTL